MVKLTGDIVVTAIVFCGGAAVIGSAVVLVGVDALFDKITLAFGESVWRTGCAVGDGVPLNAVRDAVLATERAVCRVAFGC